MSETSQESNNSNRVFVGGISWKANEESLAKFFSAYGNVTECKIIMDKITGKSKGYGFVTFQETESANNVKKTANLYFLGKMMNVGDAVRRSDAHKQQQQHYGQSAVQYNQGFVPVFSPYYPTTSFYPGQPIYGMNPYVPVGVPYTHPMTVPQQFQDPSLVPSFTPMPGWQPTMYPPGMYPQRSESGASNEENENSPNSPPSPSHEGSPQDSSTLDNPHYQAYPANGTIHPGFAVMNGNSDASTNQNGNNNTTDVNMGQVPPSPKHYGATPPYSPYMPRMMYQPVVHPTHVNSTVKQSSK